ncbi:MAG TPA: SpoIIE family protein phosphatase [Verrucomicrobiae bacterium]
MPEITVRPDQSVAWGVATRPLAGQSVSGDGHLVKPFSGGVLMAVLDGIGHGEEAAAAVNVAVGILETCAGEWPTALIQRCHIALKNTRGAVMTVASLDISTGQLAWSGVGNVEGLLVRSGVAAGGACERLVLRNGVVGYELPDLRVSTTAMVAGDVLVLATDGVSPGFAPPWERTHSPQRIADRILSQNLKSTDDALVLVARYWGDGDE